ncbi:hypothetical protein ACGFIW_01405 [Micromonospora sp. NPDC048935]|uniref:hypothetical protein n=1 Tax=Micromonospora sp. NPDC048935 TaxID=3364262 RepID=UPI003718DB91
MSNQSTPSNPAISAITRTADLRDADRAQADAAWATTEKMRQELLAKARELRAKHQQ